jgi:hypothetical protein
MYALVVGVVVAVVAFMAGLLLADAGEPDVPEPIVVEVLDAPAPGPIETPSTTMPPAPRDDDGDDESPHRTHRGGGGGGGGDG